MSNLTMLPRRENVYSVCGSVVLPYLSVAASDCLWKPYSRNADFVCMRWNYLLNYSLRFAWYFFHSCPPKFCHFIVGFLQSTSPTAFSSFMVFLPEVSVLHHMIRCAFCTRLLYQPPTCHTLALFMTHHLSSLRLP